MDIQRSETTPNRILQLKEVLQRTGLSRATLYNRIAKSDFPHQVSLGGRAVGWIKGEVEDWINERIPLRPGSAKMTPEAEPHDAIAISAGSRSGKRGEQPSTKPIECLISVNNGSPDPAKIQLVGTMLYFDKSTGSFWLKLHPEKHRIS